MGTLDEFLKTEPIDFETLVSNEIRALDNAIHPPTLFKYFPRGRSDFFKKPMLRFTQREGLNDPFELMKRWHEFANEQTRRLAQDHIQKSISRLNEQKGVLLQHYKEEQARQGIFLGPDEVAKASQLFFSPEGKKHVAEIFENAQMRLPNLISSVFDRLTNSFGQQLEELTAKFGILSLSANPISRVMWSLYASAGQGFLVEFDTSHSFFCAPNGRPLTWQVSYDDKFKESFLENPYSFFVSKHEAYRFEQEWRMIKVLSERDETISVNGSEMHMWRVLPGMIKTVTFGYNYDPRALAAEGATIKTQFDMSIRIRSIGVDRESGTFKLFELD